MMCSGERGAVEEPERGGEECGGTKRTPVIDRHFVGEGVQATVQTSVY